MPALTPTRKRKNALDKKIYDEYQRLVAEPGNMKVACEHIVMKKFGLKSRSTVHNIIKRAEARQTKPAHG